MPVQLHPLLKSSPVVHRHPANPILTHRDIAYPATLIFNAGVCKYRGKYVMLFRNDYGQWGNPRFAGTNLGVAESTDGIHWTARPKPCWQWNDEEVVRVYDPRLTVIEGKLYVCFAIDTQHGLRGGIAVTEDLETFRVLSQTLPDNRNLVLFPEKIAGRFTRLERPMLGYYLRGAKADIWLSQSPDMEFWGHSHLVLSVEQVPYATDKIGPAAPPIQTPKGWLTTFHAVDSADSRGKNGWEPFWKKRYSAGLMLLDLENPHKMIGLAKEPLLAPEAAYETDDGFRNHVIFPGGMILEASGEVKIYYGAADTAECLATADVNDLLSLCKSVL